MWQLLISISSSLLIFHGCFLFTLFDKIALTSHPQVNRKTNFIAVPPGSIENDAHGIGKASAKNSSK
jgi:hypothetical protein